MSGFFASLPLILDGATGTQLQKLGMPAGISTEKWVLDHPEALQSVQRAYVNAGSQVVYAPTFSANRVGLKKCGLENAVDETCRRLVAVSREAVGSRAFVGGDMSPTGLLLEPFGNATYDQLKDIFAEQAKALDDSGVDFFAVETMMYLDEGKAAVEAIRSVSDKPVLVSFTCGPTGRTIWGESFTQLVTELSPLGIDAFGVNCCGDPELVISIIDELRSAADLPIIAKPNAGLPKNIDGKAVYPMTPEEFGRNAKRFIEHGASLLGGCCGTDERHIAAVRAAICP